MEFSFVWWVHGAFVVLWQNCYQLVWGLVDVILLNWLIITVFFYETFFFILFLISLNTFYNSLLKNKNFAIAQTISIAQTIVFLFLLHASLLRFQNGGLLDAARITRTLWSEYKIWEALRARVLWPSVSFLGWHRLKRRLAVANPGLPGLMWSIHYSALTWARIPSPFCSIRAYYARPFRLCAILKCCRYYFDCTASCCVTWIIRAKARCCCDKMQNNNGKVQYLLNHCGRI